MIRDSIKALAASKLDFDALLLRLDLSTSPNDWLHQAYAMVQRLAGAQRPDGYIDLSREEYPEKINLALYDVILLKDILPYIGDEDPSILRLKIKKILQIVPLNLETIQYNQARNTLWELKFLTRIKQSGVQAHLREPNPDILIQFSSRKYFVQCKRIYNTVEGGLKGNIEKAVAQLQADLEKESGDALGILALSLERPLAGNGQLVLTAKTEGAAKASLLSLLEGVREEYGALWQDIRRIKDPRIVAIALHIVVPSRIGPNNMFAIGSQIIINNTWADGKGFQLVQQDFEKIQDSLEGSF